MKVVGITTWKTRESGRFFATVSEALVEGLSNEGVIVRLIPTLKDPEKLRRLLSEVDGLVFPGGEDVSPFLYGEDPESPSGIYDFERDHMELILMKEALAAHLPILAICRGMQLLNVSLGGSLRTLPPGKPDHGGKDAFLRENHHKIICREGSLYEIFGGVVNSYHRQGVARLGEGLRPEAWAKDGVVEGLSLEGHPEVFAMQFHPEFLPGVLPLLLRAWLGKIDEIKEGKRL